VQVHFSKEMMSLDNIGLNEYPDSGIGLGYYSRMEDIENGGVTKTQLNLFHPSRAFSPDGKDYWYFPTVPGTVKAVNQFCMYPGRGPDATVPQVGISSPACAVTYSDAGRVLSVSGCMPSDLLVTSSTDTGCISTNHQVSKTQPNTDTCLELLQNDVVSPTQF